MYIPYLKGFYGAFDNGVIVISEKDEYFHGKKVAFTTLVQLLENTPMDENKEDMERVEM